MKLNYLLVAIVAVLLFSCKSNNILNDENIETQIFSLNINRDTTLVTKSNCIIRIPKGCLESDSENIKLEVKEALTNTDIVLAGLTTVSGKQALSSGGMLYINAADGYKVSIKKELAVLLPTKDYKPGMSIFKGTDSAGKINWTEPEPLPKDSTLLSIEAGKQLFQANCANCHKTNSDFTGPGMAGITKKRKLEWIYQFVRNPMSLRAYNTEAKLLFDIWSPTVMTSFPNLKNTDINNILAYVETSADKNWKAPASYFIKDSTASENFLCMDSCFKYQQALEELENKKAALEDSTEEFFTLDQTIPVPPQTAPVNSNNNPPPQIQSQPATQQIIEKVEPTYVKATFYTVNIKAFGWYNIDILMKERSNCLPSELFVRLQGNYETDFQVMLIVPSVKAFVEGGKLKDDKLYGFDETNGKIPLPQNAQCYVIAFAEVGDKLIFGKTAFFAALTQTIDISFSETTKEGLQEQIKALKLDGIGAVVNDSKKAENIKVIEKISTEAEKIKPKNCNCDFMASDSARIAQK